MKNKKIFKIALALLFTIVYSFILFAEEQKETISVDGREYYLDDVLDALTIIKDEEKDKNTNDERGWVLNEKDEWHFIADDGEYVKNAIMRKDNMEFYLDEKGDVLKEQLLNIDNNTYYCNYFGALAKNCWVKVKPEMVDVQWDPMPDVYWYYFDGSGKAVKGQAEKPLFYDVDGLTYLFNSEGQMLKGWLTEKGEILDPIENDRPFEEAVYHTTDNGNLTAGWVTYENPYVDNEDLMNMGKLWFYFDKKTHKKRGNGKDQLCNIGPSSYVFSDKGYVMTGFTYYNSDNSNREEYFGDDKNGGGKYKAKWAYTIPPKDGTYTEEDNERKNWMYIQKGGIPIKNAMRKINDDYYVFDENGIMRSGIVAFLNGTILFVTDMDKTSGADIVKKGKYTYKKDGETYYFYDALVNTYGMTDYRYFAGSDYPDLDGSGNVIEVNDFATMDSECNSKRDFRFTGRRTYTLPYYILDKDEIGVDYNPNIKYFYFSDAGDKLEGSKTIHMMDDDYVFASNRSGHYHGRRGEKYYYDGILLRADDEIGYGLLNVEDSYKQVKQCNIYYHMFVPYSYGTMNVILVDSSNYDTVINDDLNAIWPEQYDGSPSSAYTDRYYYSYRNSNESIYKVVDSNGKVVKSKKEAYKDKQGRYWFIDGKDNYCFGIFETPIKRMKSKFTFNTILDVDTCPEVFKTGTKQEMIDYFRKITCASYIPGSDNNIIEKFIAEDLLSEDIKDYYTFIKSGTIKDVSIEKDKKDPKKFQISIMYDGVHYKSERNEKQCFIPFGISDDGDRTATFFPGMNDFEIVPEDNDLLVNCCWDDNDAIDLMDRNGDGIIDYT